MRDVSQAGGDVERANKGRMRITGPSGTVTIQEPADESRKDLARSSARKLITERTGLAL